MTVEPTRDTTVKRQRRLAALLHMMHGVSAVEQQNGWLDGLDEEIEDGRLAIRLLKIARLWGG